MMFWFPLAAQAQVPGNQGLYSVPYSNTRPGEWAYPLGKARPFGTPDSPGGFGDTSLADNGGEAA